MGEGCCGGGGGGGLGSDLNQMQRNHVCSQNEFMEYEGLTPLSQGEMQAGENILALFAAASLRKVRTRKKSVKESSRVGNIFPCTNIVK